MAPKSWKYIFCNEFYPPRQDCLKYHVIGEVPREQALEHLQAKFGMSGYELTERDKLHYEPGGFGSYCMDQPKESFSIYGRKFTTESANVEQVLLELNNAEPEDGLFILKNARMLCAVFSEAEHNLLRDSLTKRMPRIRERANAFLDRQQKSWVEDPGRLAAGIITPQDVIPKRVSN